MEEVEIWGQTMTVTYKENLKNGGSYAGSGNLLYRSASRLFFVRGLSNATDQDLQVAADHIRSNEATFPGDPSLSIQTARAVRGRAGGTAYVLAQYRLPGLSVFPIQDDGKWHSKTQPSGSTPVTTWFRMSDSAASVAAHTAHWWDGKTLNGTPANETGPYNKQPLLFVPTETIWYFDKLLSSNPLLTYEGLVGFVNSDTYQGASANTLRFISMDAGYDPDSGKYPTRFVFLRRPYGFFTDYVQIRADGSYDWSTYGRSTSSDVIGVGSFASLPSL